MKKTNLFTTLVVIFTFWMGGFSIATAQRVSAKWEANFNKELQDMSIYDYFLGEDESSYYLLNRKIVMFKPMKYSVIKYDKKSLQPKGTKMQDDAKYKYFIYDVYRILGKTFLYGKDFGGKYRIFEFNLADQTISPMENIFSIELTSSGFQHTISPDSSNILFIARKKADGKSDTDNFQLLLLDAKFNKIWEKEVSTPFINASSFALDNDRNIYIAGKAYESGTKRNSTDRASYECAILKLSGDNLAKQQFKVNMDNKLYQKCEIFLDKKNTLFAVGFYSDKSNISETGGFYFSLDKEFSTAQNLSYNPIKLEHLKLNHDRTVAKKIENNYSDYRYAGFNFNQVLYADNGDVVICFEDGSDDVSTSPVYNTTMRQGGGTEQTMTTKTSTTEHSYYWDAYIFRANTETGLTWMKRVPKFQKSSDRDKMAYTPRNGDFLSYKAFLSGDNVVLFFMDSPRNAGLNESSEKISIAWNVMVQPMSVVLDKEGVQKRQLVNIGNGELVPEVLKSVPVSNTKAFISERKGKKCKVGVISVDK